MLFIMNNARRLRDSFNEKGAEWISSLFMIGWSVTLAFPGDMLATPQFSAFHRFAFMTEVFWACTFGIIGGARVVALFLNGDFTRGPTLRILGSSFGFVTWLQVSALLTEGAISAGGILTTGTLVYAIVAVADLYSIVRIASDRRYERH